MNPPWNVRIFPFSCLGIITRGYFAILILYLWTAQGTSEAMCHQTKVYFFVAKMEKKTINYSAQMKMYSSDSLRIIANIATKSEISDSHYILVVSIWLFKKLLMVIICEHWRRDWTIFLKYIFPIILFCHLKYKAKPNHTQINQKKMALCPD